MSRALEWLEARRTQMVEALGELVEHESPSLDKALLDTLAERLAHRFQAVGAEVELIRNPAGGNHVRAAVRPVNPEAAARPPALVLCHFDTVWPAGTLAQRPFHVEDGRAKGPGTFDMKAGIILLEFALAALRACRLEPGRPVVALLTSDEEISSPHSRTLIEVQASSAAHALVLESPLNGGKLKTSRKGVGRYSITIQGRSAHAGLEPEKGVSAVHELAQQVIRLQALRRLELGTTVNVGVISGGTRANVVAASAQAEVDVRVATLAEAARIHQALLALEPVLPGACIQVTGGLERPPMERSPAIAELFARAQVIARRSLGVELQEGSAGGASDGNLTAALGLPTLDGLGAPGNGAHAEHEHVLVDALPARAALIAALLAEL